MSWRVGLVVVVALAAGALGEGHQLDVSPPDGALYGIWYGGALPWVLLGLLVLTGFVVRRWWATLVFLGPLSLAIYLQATGHQSPWEGVGPPLDPWWTGFWYLAYAVPVLCGIGLRVACEAARRGTGRRRRPADSTAS